MRKSSSLLLAVLICLSASSVAFAERSIELVGDPSVGTPWLLYENFGGTWHDAEKSSDNDEDDLMCWAAGTANMLAWGGWGQPGVTGTSSQEIFQYYQDHWTNMGGEALDAIDWWFTGINPSQGKPDWSQVDVPGGGFYPELSSYDYRSYGSNDDAILRVAELFLKRGIKNLDNRTAVRKFRS